MALSFRQFRLNAIPGNKDVAPDKSIQTAYNKSMDIFDNTAIGANSGPGAKCSTWRASMQLAASPLYPSWSKLSNPPEEREALVPEAPEGFLRALEAAYTSPFCI